jgi:hypothetical protein
MKRINNNSCLPNYTGRLLPFFLITKRVFYLILIAILFSCTKKQKESNPIVVQPPDTTKTEIPEPLPNNFPTAIIVDCAKTEGDIMRFEQANVHSTTSPLPSENTKTWVKNLNHSVLRTWIQLRYVYNKGNINYNYKYAGSNVPLEASLAYYSSCADSLLIALSAYNATATWPLPQGNDFKNFIKETLIYYKQKYPKIKYIQVGNEPDHSGETMETYYPIYKTYYQAVNEANTYLNLTTNRLLISNGPFTSNVPNMLVYARSFLKAYVNDKDPNKKLDFFSFHSYGETNRPAELLTAQSRIDAEMAYHKLPKIPVFVTEFGIVGGSDLPNNMTLGETILMQAAGQLTKAYYLYQGGIKNVFNWNIHHGSIDFKSQLKDIQNAYPYPYGNALTLSRELSARKNRISAVSSKINHLGLGTHALASMNTQKGIAILIWNYNWRETTFNQDFNIEIKNIPTNIFSGQINNKIYLIDSKNNNYFNNSSQSTLTVTKENTINYTSSIKIPLNLEKTAVALILLTP